jgi:hypothetical protein
MAEEEKNGEEASEEESMGFKVSDRRLSVRGYDEEDEEESSPEPSAPPPEPDSPPVAEETPSPPPAESGPDRSGEAEPPDASPEDPEARHFETLIAILQGNALAAMGLNPQTGERVGEPEPRSAKMMVDLIGMLKEKMAGNLTDDEDKLITQILSDLRMIYVQQVGIG